MEFFLCLLNHESVSEEGVNEGPVQCLLSQAEAQPMAEAAALGWALVAAANSLS